MILPNYSLITSHGFEATISVEIGIPTPRVLNFNSIDNEEELRLSLDLLNERCELTAIREALYK